MLGDDKDAGILLDGNLNNSVSARSVLDLDSESAMTYFLGSAQYCGFELPEYFVFDELLGQVRKAVGDKAYEDCLQKGRSPEQSSDVNLDIMLNKDGRYAVRPMVLANPFLYYFLVRELCNEQSWEEVKYLFEKFQSIPRITACAMPLVVSGKEKFHKSATILNWWQAMEQRSIELSLEYRYMFVTDIANCYGSVNPQVFEWAFSLKGTKHERAVKSDIAGNVQKYLCALQQGRNIGIPQGSAIFDMLGEIILGYSDILLHEAVEKAFEEAGTEVPPYKVLRYRDDYRVFCNDRGALEKISYTLQHVLGVLNFRMNNEKTKISESIITDSVKKDKLAYIYNTPVFKKGHFDFGSFEKYLLFILMFGREYPDCGSIKTLLSDIDKRIEKHLEPREREVLVFGESGTEVKKEKFRRSISGGSIRALSAICVQIALENVSSCHYALRVVSHMINSLEDEEERWYIINHVYDKLCNRPNSDYIQLWLQNMTYQQDKKNGSSRYNMRLCRVVAKEEGVKLWNNEWLKKSVQKDVDMTSIVDEERLMEVTPVITFRERRAYLDAISSEEALEIGIKHLEQERIQDELNSIPDMSDVDWDEGEVLGTFLKVSDTPDASAEQWQLLKDKERVQKMFPELSDVGRVILVRGLIRTVNESGDPIMAYGMFKGGVLYISDQAPKGTAFHEAFHYVTRTLLLDKEKEKMFAEAEKVYGMSDRMALEERLAEDFRTYMNGMTPCRQNMVKLFERIIAR